MKISDKVEIYIPEQPDSQYEQDLKILWKMVMDGGNPAKRPWRFNMTEKQRHDWVMSKTILSEYSLPRTKSRRWELGVTVPEGLPAYVSKKWLDSLNQAGYENHHPLTLNSTKNSQYPARYCSVVREECTIGLEATKFVTPEDLKKSRVCILVDSTLDNNKPFHCLL